MTSPIRLDRPLMRPLESMEEAPRFDAGAKASDGSFSDLFRKAINDASSLQDDSGELIKSFLRGEPVELHQLMAASEEAGIALDLLVQIRNKLSDAYRTVMSTQ
jgi:flagellar hook-basal body complex protein FliE